MKLEPEENITRRICSLMYAERKFENISQQELCSHLGITQGLLSKIENTKLSPSVYVWLTFCKIFSLDPAIAMTETLFRKRMNAIKKLSPKSKK